MKTKIKIAAIFTFAIFALMFFVPKAEMQTKQVETAGQHFKNIKVLNDMPTDQLGKVMNMMSASLGVNCNFCHIEDDFAKEGNEHKDITRDMIKMTFDLNKNYFGGKQEMSCNTCHQGNSHPQSAINLYPAPREERPKQPDAKPSVEQILTKYETALGGKTNISKITSRQIKAQRIEPDNKTFEEETIFQKGAKTAIETKYGDYVISEIYDGVTASKFGGNKDLHVHTDELEQIKREAQLFAGGDLSKIYEKMEFRAADKIDGRDVNLIIASTADNMRERLYFDAISGLLVRRIAAVPTVLGAFQYQIDYLDYKDFGGVKLPTVVKFAVPNIRWTRKILEVKNNVKIDDAKFGK